MLCATDNHSFAYVFSVLVFVFLLPFVALLWTCSNSSMSFSCWGLQKWTQYSRWGLMRAEWRGRTTSLNLLVTLLLMQPRIQLACWAARTHWQLMLNFSSIDTPKSFSSELLSSHSLPNLYLCLVFPFSRCRTLHLALLNFMRLAWAHLSSLSRSLWIASLPSSMSTTTQLGVICKLVESTLNPIVHAAYKDVK